MNRPARLWSSSVVAAAFGLGALVAWLALAGGPTLSSAATPAAVGAAFAGPFEARVVRVVDGDTFAARFAVWFGQEVETLVRLRGADAPELAGRCGAERAQALAARDELAALLAAGRVTLARVGADKYFGRVVADVAVEAADGSFPRIDVAAVLIAGGLARPYDGRARSGWCEVREARAAR